MLNSDETIASSVCRNEAMRGIRNIGEVQGRGFELMNNFLNIIKGIIIRIKKFGKTDLLLYFIGYQVRYSLKKDFSSGVKKKSVKGYNKTSVKISKLKAKKTHYVQVRTYMKVDGKTYYSPWSKTSICKDIIE